MNLFVIGLLVGAWALSPIITCIVLFRVMRKGEAIADRHGKEHDEAIAALRLHLKYMTEGLMISRENESSRVERRRKYINAIEVLRRENADLRVANAEMKNAT